MAKRGPVRAIRWGEGYFFDEASIQSEFGGAGLYAVENVMESYPFYLVRWRKK